MSLVCSFHLRDKLAELSFGAVMLYLQALSVDVAQIIPRQYLLYVCDLGLHRRDDSAWVGYRRLTIVHVAGIVHVGLLLTSLLPLLILLLHHLLLHGLLLLLLLLLLLCRSRRPHQRDALSLLMLLHGYSCSKSCVIRHDTKTLLLLRVALLLSVALLLLLLLLLLMSGRIGHFASKGTAEKMQLPCTTEVVSELRYLLSRQLSSIGSSDELLQLF